MWKYFFFHARAISSGISESSVVPPAWSSLVGIKFIPGDFQRYRIANSNFNSTKFFFFLIGGSAVDMNFKFSKFASCFLFCSLVNIFFTCTKHLRNKQAGHHTLPLLHLRLASLLNTFISLIHIPDIFVFIVCFRPTNFDFYTPFLFLQLRTFSRFRLTYLGHIPIYFSTKMHPLHHCLTFVLEI
jgi:hypothetical protein